MIESPAKRQDNGQVDEDYGRPSKRQRMSVEPSEGMSTLEPQDSVNPSSLDEHVDTDEAELQPVEVTRASDLYLDTVCTTISIIQTFRSHLQRLIGQSLTLILKKFAQCRFQISTHTAAWSVENTFKEEDATPTPIPTPFMMTIMSL